MHPIEEEKVPLAKVAYQRENLEPVDPEECKQDGQWTKWVLERCTEEQKQMYHKLRQLADENGLAYLSNNHVLRYLKSFEWKIEEALNKLITTEQWRRENQCMEVSPAEIDKELAMKVT